MKASEAIERCKILLAEEKMLNEQKAILQSEKFADTVPSVQTVIDDIDDYLNKIPGAIKDSLESVEPDVPAVPQTATINFGSANDVITALAVAAILKLAR